MKVVVFVGLMLGGSAFANSSISVQINGIKYICAENECPYTCEGRLPSSIKCNGEFVNPTGKTGQIVLLEKSGGQVLGCLASIAKESDFEALATCMEMRRRICE